jgi:hypothetical protein
MQLLEKSINEVGVIESISVTKEGTIISGHARKATFDKQGKKPKEVHLSDNEYPVIVRDDIEDNTELYYKAQILANTTSKQNIDLDTELIEEIAVEYDLDIEELGIEVDNSNINDIEEVSGFNESVKFTIECTNISELEQLQTKLNTPSKKLSYADFLIKVGL